MNYINVNALQIHDFFNSWARTRPLIWWGLFSDSRNKTLTDLSLSSRPSAETYCVFLWRHDKIRSDSYLILFTLFHWQGQKTPRAQVYRGFGIMKDFITPPLQACLNIVDLVQSRTVMFCSTCWLFNFWELSVVNSRTLRCLAYFEFMNLIPQNIANV